MIADSDREAAIAERRMPAAERMAARLRRRTEEIEKRGAVKALRAEAERLHNAGQGADVAAAHALLSLAGRIESGEVTL